MGDLPHTTVGKAARTRLWFGLALALASGAALAADDRPTPSGLPVPRYVSLKFDQVNARAGPGEDYRALWVYRVKGLPLQVVAETREWRRVCDPDGGMAWVKATATGGRRMVMRLSPKPLALLEDKKPGAKVRDYLAGRSLAVLDKCKDGWCKVHLDGTEGWAPAAEFWGTDDRVQCR